MEQRGRGLCPFCGSPQVYYNPNFESWRCSRCEKSFQSPSYGSWRHDPHLNTPTAKLRNEGYGGIPRKPPPPRKSTPSSGGLPGWLISGVIIFTLLLVGIIIWAYKGDDITAFFGNLPDIVADDSIQYDSPAATESPETAAHTAKDIDTITSTTEEAYTDTPAADNISADVTTEKDKAQEEEPEPELSFNERLIISTFLLINMQRVEHELNELKPDSLLFDLADEHSLEMVQYGYFSHDRMPGSRDMMWGTQTGYMRGENIFMVPERRTIPGRLLSTDELAVWVVSDWMDSPGHRENILKNEFTHTGLGLAYSNGYYYVTQVFEGPMY